MKDDANNIFTMIHRFEKERYKKMRRHGHGGELLLDNEEDVNRCSDNSVTVEVPTESRGLSITYTRQVPSLSTIASFQIPLRCAQNMRLRGDQIGKLPRNKTTMMLRLLPNGKKTTKEASASTQQKPRTRMPRRVKCPDCDSKFSGKGPLANHRRFKHCTMELNSSSSSVSPTLEDALPSSNPVSTEDTTEEPVESTASGRMVHNDQEESMEDGHGNIGDLDSSAEEQPAAATVADHRQRDGDHMICKLCNERHWYRTKVQRKAFEMHMEIHYGQRPFFCPQCDNAYKSAIKLLTHTTTHTEEYNFGCAVCPIKFKNQRQLMAHNKTCK